MLANASTAQPAPAVNVVHLLCIVCVYRSPDSFLRPSANESTAQPAPVVNVVHMSYIIRVYCGLVSFVRTLADAPPRNLPML